MRRKVLMAAVLLITVWLLWEAEALREAAWEGLALCAGSVIPALFPFLAASSLLLKLGFGDALAGPLAPLMGRRRGPWFWALPEAIPWGPGRRRSSMPRGP